MSQKFSEGQRLALLLSAKLDNRLSTIERAAAQALADTLNTRRAPCPGLLIGVRLTAEGLEEVRQLLARAPAVDFPAIVEQMLARFRADGHRCADVRLTALPGGGWRLSWDGDGWHMFSLFGNGRHVTARANREELLRSALKVGLVLPDEESDPEATYADFIPRPVYDYSGDDPDEFRVSETPLSRCLRILSPAKAVVTHCRFDAGAFMF